MIHVGSINDTFGCIKTDETYVIEGEVYEEKPPIRPIRQVSRATHLATCEERGNSQRE